MVMNFHLLGVSFHNSTNLNSNNPIVMYLPTTKLKKWTNAAVVSGETIFGRSLYDSFTQHSKPMWRSNTSNFEWAKKNTL